MIRKTITAIKNWFTDTKQEPEVLFKPLAKLEEPKKLETVTQISDRIVETARKYVGVKEQGANNHGPMVEKFQKAVDGRALGEPWCLAFVQFVAAEVSETYGILNPLYKTEHCQTLYSSTLDKYKRRLPSEGTIFIKKARASLSGHAGFNTNGGTIEGNTNDGVSRDGDGVYEKHKPIADDLRMFVRGHIDLPQMIYDQILIKQRSFLP